MIDLTEQILAITAGVLTGSILIRCLIRKCKRDCYDVHLPAPANTPQPPRQIIIHPEEQQQISYPQPTAPPSYPYYTQQNNPYNSYSSYPQDQRYVVYIPPTARHV